MVLTRIHLDFRVPASNFCLPHPGREKGTTSIHLCREGGVCFCSPMQGRVGWTFPEREPGLALAPGVLITPHPSLLQRAAKASSGQDYVYWVDHGEAAGTDRPGGAERSRGRWRGDQHRRRDRLCASPLLLPYSLTGRAGRGLVGGLNISGWPSKGKERAQPLCSLLQIPKSWGPGEGEQDLTLLSLSFACPELACLGPQSLDSPGAAIQIQQKQCFSWKAELRWDEGRG